MNFKRIVLRAAATVIVLTAVAAAGAFWYDKQGFHTDADFDAHVDAPANVTRHPRVVFDVAHHEWHTPTGRYQPLAELLRRDGYRVSTNERSFVASALDSVDVLIVPNAAGPAGHEHWPAFTLQEDTVIASWVEAGGALLLIADHVPFGAAAERLAAQLGVTMHLAFARDGQNSGWDNERLVFSRDNGLLGSHPILEGKSIAERIRRVETFTGQSLSVPPGAVALLRMSDVSYDWKSRRDRASARGHAQGIALHFGKGRLVVLGEAALLSAQKDALGFKVGMNRPSNDNRQLALNIVRWLAGTM